jgi:hypothetical protein
MAGKARFTEWIKTMFEGYGDLLAYFENSSMYNCLATVFDFGHQHRRDGIR